MLNIDDIKAMVKEETDKLNKIGLYPEKVTNVTIIKSSSFYADINHITHELRVSLYYLGADPEEIRGTIMHELIHIVPGTGRGHGKEWRNVAEIVNKNYPQYDIKRLGSQLSRSESSFNLSAAANKVRPLKNIEIKCECCGQVYVRHRESNLTLHPEVYRCTCGGKLHRI